jgi:hypothetical protein
MKRKRESLISKRMDDFLIPDLFSLVLKYLPFSQLHELKQIYPRNVSYYLQGGSIEDKIRDVCQISCGYSHSMVLAQDGVLYGYGKNSYGELGLGHKDWISSLKMIMKNVKSVSCGYEHTMILTTDNVLYSCGRNDYGQLGLEHRNAVTTFTKVREGISKILCKGCYSLILTNNRELYGCGNRVLSFGSDATFIKIRDDIKSMSCGGGYIMILTKDDVLYGCGWNDHGQLGLGKAFNDTLGKRKKVYKFKKILEDVSYVSCGHDFTMILTKDNVLYGCGSDYDGQLGLDGKNFDPTPDNIHHLSHDGDVHEFTKIRENVAKVSCGMFHTMVLTMDNELYSCGYNEYGQLGIGHTKCVSKLTKLHVRSNEQLDGIVNVSCGEYHTIVSTTCGFLYGIGSNDGRLGICTCNEDNITKLTKLYKAPSLF